MESVASTLVNVYYELSLLNTDQGLFIIIQLRYRNQFVQVQVFMIKVDADEKELEKTRAESPAQTMADAYVGLSNWVNLTHKISTK